MSAARPIPQKKIAPLHARAREHQAQGRLVFPLGAYGRGRKLPQKDSHGHKDATLDLDQIDAWWTQTPNANIGIATGVESGFIVIEDDPRHGGAGTLALLEAELGTLPEETYTVRSGSGGRHRYFLHPGSYVKSGANRFGEDYPGVDVKADGAYVVGAGSVHPNGKLYVVAKDAPYAALTQTWIAKLVSTQPAKPELPAQWRQETADFAGDGQRWLDWAIDKKRDGTSDFYGQQLAVQLLVNCVSDPQQWLREYASAATYDVNWPFDDRDISGWLHSAEQSNIVRNGTPAPERRLHMVKAVDANEEGKEQQQDEESAADTKEEKGGGRGPSIAVLVIAMATAKCTFFHDQEREAWVSFPTQGHRETVRVNSTTFWNWLEGEFYEATERTVNAAAKAEAQGVFRHKATKGPEYIVHVRIAECDGVTYVDLANDTRQVVKITSADWEVVSEYPVKFWRPKGMLPLPVPVKGGKVNDLRTFVNIEDEEWSLLVGFLVGCYRASEVGGHPVLPIGGEQGSAKSTLGRVIRSLVDPNRAPLRAEPSDKRDLMIAARNCRLLAFDNLSGNMQNWLSDSLCRISTGGGHATRQLYTNADEEIFDSTRPILLTSIADVASKSDLVDRSIFLSLPRIPEEKRWEEGTFWPAFHEASPRILGALYTAVSMALKNLPTTKEKNLPRMADFAKFVIAAEPALHWKSGTFLEAYRANRAAANKLALDASLVGTAMLGLIPIGGNWKGTSLELLAALNKKNPENEKKPGWPSTPRAMSGAIRTIAPNLRAEGFTIPEKTKKGDRGNIWEFTRIEIKGPQPPSPPEGAPTPNTNGFVRLDVGLDVSTSISTSSPTSSPTGPDPMRESEASGGDGGTNSFISNGHYSDRTSAFATDLAERIAQLNAEGIRGDAAVKRALAERGALPAPVVSTITASTSGWH